MKPRTMYSRVSIEADLDSLAKAREATAAVLHALRDRLTANEAAHASAQLPVELKALWRGGPPSPARPIKMHTRDFMERVRLEAGLPSTRKAELVTDAVFAALKEHLSEGESDDILAQLPRDLKRVWMHA